MTIGVDDAGHDFKVFTATSGKHITVDGPNHATVNVEAIFEDTIIGNGSFDLSESGDIEFVRNLKVLTDANTTTQAVSLLLNLIKVQTDSFLTVKILLHLRSLKVGHIDLM